MILEIMREIRNTFWDGYIYRGKIAVRGGVIDLNDDFVEGDYVFLVGKRGAEVYRLERFDEEIGAAAGIFKVDTDADTIYEAAYRLTVPKDFSRLAAEIAEYERSKPKNNFAAEQFGSYRYAHGKGGNRWETLYRRALNKYRKMSDRLLG